MNAGVNMIWDILDMVSKEKPVEHNKFIGMPRQEGLLCFSGNYKLMLKTLWASRLHICTDGIIREIGEH